MSQSPRPDGFPTPGVGTGVILLLACALFAIRLAAPPDLRDNDQERPAAYAMDLLRNGHWVVQFDQTGDVMSKPPVSTWLTALTALPFGKLNLFLLYLPSFLAVLATALIIHAVGQRRFSPLAGLLAAVLFLCSMVALKEVALARTDPVFAALVFVASLLAFRASCDGRRWLPFWLVAAAATLTKGPLGVVLALGGLLAFLGERPLRNPLRGRHLPGLLLFLGLTAGWFLLAFLVEGRVVADKMILRELVGHVVKKSSDGFEFAQLAKPTLYFLGRFAPWSLLAAAGIVLAFRRTPKVTDDAQYPGDEKEPDPTGLRFRRFLAVSVLFGLFLFSLSSHQRPDHLFPLIPAAALLAGHTLAGLMAGWPTARVRKAIALLAVFFLGSVAYWGFFLRAKAEAVRETVALRTIAAEIRETYGPGFSPEFVKAHYTLQFYLGSMRSELRPEIAAGLLGADQPLTILTNRPDAIEDHLLPGISLHRIREWPLPGPRSLWMVSNKPAETPR